MSSKLRRKSRDLAVLFAQEYLLNPDEAIVLLTERLEDQRSIVKRWTFSLLNLRYPELNLSYD